MSSSAPAARSESGSCVAARNEVRERPAIAAAQDTRCHLRLYLHQSRVHSVFVLRPLGLLDDAEVEMASVLRINRPFMEYMRKNFGKIARQKHGVTLTHQRGGGSSLKTRSSVIGLMVRRGR